MKDQLIIDKLPKANTFSSKLLNINTNVFPDNPHEHSEEREYLDSNLFEKDEESEFLLNDSMYSQSSSMKFDKNNSKFVYLLMFFNICRSFIAIGVLAIPFSLSKIGKKIENY
jgi:hypothetical protein